MQAEIYVFDTSSLAQIRVIERIGKSGEAAVFEKLTELVVEDRLVFPAQVVVELGQYTPGDKKGQRSGTYLPHEWAKEHKRRAARTGPLLEVVAELLAHPQVCKVLDPDKQGVEEADLHVLALAYHAKSRGQNVLVVNEESRDRPTKLSLSTACGLLRLYCLRVEPFLVQQGIVAP